MSGEDRYLFEYVIAKIKFTKSKLYPQHPGEYEIELLQDVEPLEDITAKIDSVVYPNKTQVGEDDA